MVITLTVTARPTTSLPINNQVKDTYFCSNTREVTPKLYRFIGPTPVHMVCACVCVCVYVCVIVIMLLNIGIGNYFICVYIANLTYDSVSVLPDTFPNPMNHIS